jgi:hypothetical protein
MSDFPNPAVLPQFIHPWTQYGISNDVHFHITAAPPASITWVANQAIYMPVSIPWPYPVARIFWVNGATVANNADFAIYTPSGARIFSAGSTVTAGASAPQFVTPGTPFLLDAGDYYFAWNCSGTTTAAFGVVMPTAGQAALCGILSQAVGAVALPATATFATAPLTVGPVLCGITRTASGF